MAKQINLFGIIDEWTADDLDFQMRNTSEKQIDIYLSCYGGSIDKGIQIYNQIQALQASGSKEIHTYNLSHADSIATVVFLAAKKENRHIVESSIMFKHEPRYNFMINVTKKNADKASEKLKIEKNRIADIYVKSIEGLTKNEAVQLMEEEKTLTAQDMLKMGIVGEIMPNFEMVACKKELTNFNNKNMGLFNSKEKETNIAKTKEGKSIVFVGENLSKDTEIVTITGERKENFSGDWTLESGQIVKVNEKNKVTEVIQNSNDQGNSELINELSNVVTESLKPLQEENEKLKEELTNLKNEVKNIREKGSNGAPPKGNGENQNIQNNAQGRSLYKFSSDLAKQVRENLKKERE